LSEIDPIVALEVEAERTAKLLEGLSDDDWKRPTRCPPLDLRQLAVHTLRAGLRLVELMANPVSGEPEKGTVTYYRFDPKAVGVGVVERAQNDAEALAGRDLVKEWRDGFAAAAASARENLDDDPVLATPVGTIRLREYIPTRCVELTIHTMDLRDALGMQPDPTAEGLAVACDVLRAMLGTDLRPMGMDDVRFALTGTGRAELTQAEREMLGPLSGSFPLLQ
jgi:uncharacterized protein (TIGR03083 family)